jgi:phospholipid transport system substrate-binding protein
MKPFVNYIFLNLFISLFISLFSSTAFAVSSPLDMLKPTSDQMLAELKANQATLKSNPQKVFSIVHRILLPHVDMATMARSVVGRSEWNNANSQDQQAFTTQFTDLLIRTYASALASYTNQSVEFFPLRGGYEGQNQIQVQSQIIQPGGPPIPVNYILLLEGNQWKVIDFSVDNVSIVQNFRAQFASDLSQGGLANLTRKVTQHNADLAKQD